MSDNSSVSSARDRYLARAGNAGGGRRALLQGERSRDVRQSWPHPALQGGKFHDKKLALRLQELIGQKTGNSMSSLGSEYLRTLLMVVLRNATTDSPWPVSNNPAAKYNAPHRAGSNSFAAARPRLLISRRKS
jgi:hypothetical protein